MEIVTVARCALVAAVLAAGCDAGRSTPADTSTDALDDALDGDTVDGTLAVYALDPATGPVTGGTPVGVSGRGFVDGATVELGAALAASVTVVSPGLITLVTPLAAEAGAVDVTVQNPGGASSTLVAGFTYTEVATDRPIGWCNLQYPTATGTAAGVPTESIYGRVWVEGCTDGAAMCGGILGAAGMGSPGSDPSSFVWSADASYNPGHTADDNDEYQVSFAPPSAGTFEYAYRFSGDGGDTWTYCDLDGSTDGYDTADAGVLTVE